MDLIVLDIDSVEELERKRGKKLDEVYIKGTNIKIELAKQPTGFGYKRFLYCDRCHKRREKLYVDIVNLEVYCRGCLPLNIYKGIQNTTVGGYDYLYYRMSNLAENHGIEISFPFDYTEYLTKRPKYMRVKTWERLMIQLQIMESMRFNAIYFNIRLKVKEINFILDHWEHIDLNLLIIKKGLVNWREIIKGIN